MSAATVKRVWLHEMLHTSHMLAPRAVVRAQTCAAETGSRNRCCRPMSSYIQGLK